MHHCVLRVVDVGKAKVDEFDRILPLLVRVEDKIFRLVGQGCVSGEEGVGKRK